MAGNSIFSKKIFWFLFLSHFALNMSLTTFFLFPLKIEDMGGSRSDIGLIMGIAMLSAVAVRFLFAKTLDKLGRQIWLVTSGVLHTLSCFLYLWITHIGLFVYTVRLIHGLSVGIMFATYFTIATDIAPQHKEVRVIGIFGLSGLIPMALGPFIGELILHYFSFFHLFLTATLLSLLGMIAGLFVRETAQCITEQVSTTARQRTSHFPIKHFAIIWAISFLFGAAVNACFVFIAPFARNMGFSGISSFFAMYVFTSVIVRFFIGPLAERWRNHLICLSAIILIALGLIVLAYTKTESFLLLAGLLVGAGHGLLFPVLLAMSNDVTGPERRGTGITYTTAAMDTGALLLNPLMGWIGDLWGYSVLFLLSALMMLTPLAAFPSLTRRATHNVPQDSDHSVEVITETNYTKR